MWGFGCNGATSMLVHHFVDGRSSLITDSKPLKIPEMQHEGWLMVEHHQASTRVSSTDVKYKCIVPIDHIDLTREVAVGVFEVSCFPCLWIIYI